MRFRAACSSVTARGSCQCLATGLAGLAMGCGDIPLRPDDPAQIRAVIQEFGLTPLPAIPYPANNTLNPDRIHLGQLLFFDPILGGESGPGVKVAAGRDPYRDRSHDMACATCHHPNFAFADGRRLSAGVGGAQLEPLALGPDRVVPAPSLVTQQEVGIVPRNSPTIFNAAFNGVESEEPSAGGLQFWDGRAVGLEGQALLPIVSRNEMAGDAYGLGTSVDDMRDSVTRRVRAIQEYVAQFQVAFPAEVATASDIRIDHIARAIAAFERELVTPDSRYDRFVAGEFAVFTEEELRGFDLFFRKGLCGECHRGPMLSDYTYRVVGVAEDYESVVPGFAGKNGRGGDFGRFHADPAQLAGEKFAFRVPTIRNVELTAPYFHAGSAATLRQVMELYNRGGRGAGDLSDAVLEAEGAVRDPTIRPLDLTEQEIDAIIAFMLTTSAPLQSLPGIDLTAVPSRVPSGLVPPGVPTPDGSGPFLRRTPR